MSKGIALIFKERFDGIEELRRQSPSVGKALVLRRDGRFIYYLITKQRYFQKPTMESLRTALTSMQAHMRANGVVSLGIPRLGCGLDRLDWRAVSAMIKQTFVADNVCLTVYSL